MAAVITKISKTTDFSTVTILFLGRPLEYARYGFWYLHEMQGALPDAAKKMFMRGDHVCRHREGVWNAVFSDQFGQQTYIRYGKAKGGLVGLTLSSDQVAGWVLSYHICNTVSLSMDDMFQTNDDDEMQEQK